MAPKKKTVKFNASPEILMLGYLCVKGTEGLPEKVNILDRFGLADSDIASICDCAVQSVRDAHQKVKKKGAKND